MSLFEGDLMRLLTALVLSCTVGCARYPATRDSTNAVLWVRTAVEYEVAVRQSFDLALSRLERALAERPESPAVIMDIDETVLDNSAFEARLIVEDRPFDAGEWDAWLSGRSARAMPGAVAFVSAARRLGVAVYFITNRRERYRRPTIDTMRRAGLIDASDGGERILMRGEGAEWTSDKESRRAEVARSHRVVLLVGNDLNDFASCVGMTLEERRELVERRADRFDRDWVVIPSPTWGSWLEALHDNRRGLSDEETRALHVARLAAGL
jgi:acid phosphatase